MEKSHQDNGSGSRMPLQGDYTFTDRELHDVLGFLEMMNQPNAKDPTDIGLGVLDDIGEYVGRPNNVPPPSAGLQFQPHVTSLEPLVQFDGFSNNDSPGLLTGSGGLSSMSQNLFPGRTQPVQQHQARPHQHRAHQQNHQQGSFLPGHHVQPHSNYSRAGRHHTGGGAVDLLTDNSEMLGFGNRAMYTETKPNIRGGPGASSSSHPWSQSVNQHSQPMAKMDTHEGFPGLFAEENTTKVSHGASEKQRRDRINNMIEQLRALVPAGGGMRAMHPASFNPEAASEAKRSKYVVLVETIQLITLQNHQLKEKDKEIEALRQSKRELEAAAANSANPGTPTNNTATPAPPVNAAPVKSEGDMMAEMMNSHNVDLIEEELCSHSAAHSPDGSTPSQGSGGPAEGNHNAMEHLQGEGGSEGAGGDARPHRRSHHRSASLDDGKMFDEANVSRTPLVSIDMGHGHCYIKVTCLDRRGLLADILVALSPLPLEVKRAAITTSGTGVVTDIFEVKLDNGTDFSAEDLKAKVTENLMSEGGLGVKRKHLTNG